MYSDHRARLGTGALGSSAALRLVRGAAMTRSDGYYRLHVRSRHAHRPAGLGRRALRAAGMVVLAAFAAAGAWAYLVLALTAGAIEGRS